MAFAPSGHLMLFFNMSRGNGGFELQPDTLHHRGRSLRCPDNTLPPDKGNGLIFGKFVFGSISKELEGIQTFAQKVTIKNSAKPTLKCETTSSEVASAKTLKMR